jgi:rRNA maturation protein Nop10
MKKGVYTIKDNLAGQCGPLFDAVNDAVAWRSFKQVMQKCPDPQEYTLFRVAEFDDMLGQVELVISSEVSFNEEA